MEPTELEPFDRQDLRIAVVMNGGVSLAVWISGVAIELHHLVQGSRSAVQDQWREYAAVLDLLHAHARIDVICGTSAGGLNGGFLALGVVGDGDLRPMRQLWRDHGGLDELLRDPLQRDPRSLLRGDYFHERLRTAYQEIWATGGRGTDAASPVELILTGTLWDGRRSAFTDDMGTHITEVDYDATFRFSTFPERVGDGETEPAGDLTRQSVLEELAAASRSTASFPGAFEPHLVSTATGADPLPGGRWPSTAGLASFATSQYVVDGGVLLNKPVRPALEAIYRQPAADQVRRVLAYVVPDPAEKPDDELPDAAGDPGAAKVLLGVLTRLCATNSVARELAEIRQNNESAGLRRRARDRLAAALTASAGTLADSAWPAYQEVRAEHAARTLAKLLAPVSEGWSEQELTAAARRVPGRLAPAQGTLEAAEGCAPEAWDWGDTTVTRLGEMTVDVLKRAIWLAPVGNGSAARERIRACRADVHEALAAAAADRRDLDAYWVRAARQDPEPPARAGTAAEAAGDAAELDEWLAAALARWEETFQAGRRERLHAHALALAGHLRGAAGAVAEVCANPSRTVDPDGVQAARLQELHRYLLEGADGAEEVLRRMLRLDVVQLAFAGATDDVEQEVELVQVSTQDPTTITGVHAFHFGAFFRPSWRVNDWLRGRMDTAEHLMRILLAPERLRQLAFTPEAALERVRAIALGPGDGPDREYLEQAWAGAEEDCLAELRCLADGVRLPGALPLCAAQLARPLRTAILREELPALADAIGGEPDALHDSRRWRDQYTERARGKLTAADLWDLYERSAAIGRQRITDELRDGSDTLARTTSQAAAVLASSVAASTRRTQADGRAAQDGRPTGDGQAAARPGVLDRLRRLLPANPLGVLLSALRGYALLVWVMVRFASGGSNVGANAVTLVAACGTTLLAVGFVVPGIPGSVLLSGVVLVLAAASAAALRAGPRKVAWRLLAAGAFTLAALLWLLFADGIDLDAASGTAVRVGMAAATVLLGWWVARAQPEREFPEPPPRP